MSPWRSSGSRCVASVRKALFSASSRPHEARDAQKPGVEDLGVGRHGVEARYGFAVRDHREQRLQALRGFGQLVEAIAVGADGRAEAGDDVGDVAELLEDRVVRDGAHARRVAAIGGVLALPLDRARTGLEQQVRTKGAENGPVAVMREEFLLERAQAKEEVEAEILLRIERVFFSRRNVAVHHDRRQRARRQCPVAEEHVAVAALEARFVLHGNVGGAEAAARLVRS